MRKIVPSIDFDIRTRFEIFFGLKQSAHTDTLTESSNLIDEINHRGEIQNERKDRNAHDKFIAI